MERDFFIITRVPFMLATFFFVLAVFLGILVWTCLKGDSNTMRKLPIIFGVVHFILIVIFSIIVLVWTKYDKEAPIAWITFFPLDWPISILAKSEFWDSIFKVPVIRNIPYAITDGLIIPFINLGILGTAQYYIWGLIISKILLFLKE